MTAVSITGVGREPGVGSLSINTARGHRRAAPYKIVISAGTTGVKLRAALKRGLHADSPAFEAAAVCEIFIQQL